MSSRHPIYTIILGVLLFLVCDNAIFRSGLYDRIANPEPLVGQLYNATHYERLRQASGKKEVLLIGNSRTHWGFWCKLFARDNPDSNIEFEQLGIAGTYEKMWYYILKAVDVHHNRYAAIVIPTIGYKVDSWPLDQENNFDNASMLAPILTLGDWPTIISSFSDTNIRAHAFMLAVFSGRNYASDIQDLILHPQDRWFLLSRRKSAGSMWLSDWAGSEGSMESITYDSEGHVASFPAQLNSFERQEISNEYVRPTDGDAKRYTSINALYQSYWLNKIVALYRDSSTQLIFIQMPRWYAPLPARSPINGAPDLRNMVIKADNVTFLDENTFVPLENPKNFHDAIHLNNIGRSLFTKSLGEQVIRVLGQSH